MFMNLLYGEMAGAWIWHFVIPMLASLFIWKFMADNSHINRIIALIGVSMAASFVCHFILLLIVQSVSCSGIKNISTIALGSAIGSLIVGAMICIPAFIQPMRLVVSQLYSHHYPLLTPELQVLQQQAVQLATGVAFEAKQEKPQEKPQVGGDASSILNNAALLQKEYDYQTFKEIAMGAGFWGAFGGVYGVGIGSLYAAKCS